MHSLCSPRLRALSVLIFSIVTLILVPTAFATSVVVSDATDTHHTGVLECSVTGSAPCGLWDAITYLNLPAATAPRDITFSVASVTLSADLPSINQPMTIDGAFGAPRVVISGGGTFGGIAIGSTGGSTTTPVPPTVSGTTIKNLVIQNMGGVGISIVGGGNYVANCYVGTSADGLTAAGNKNDGIELTSTGAAFTFPPDLSATAGNMIGNPLDPTSGNLISGNGSGTTGMGINIHGQRAVLNVVAWNKIGVDKTGIIPMPNVSHGIGISGDAFSNTIGPSNIISGNTGSSSDGINISGQVMIPNVVSTNIIGTFAAFSGTNIIGNINTNLGNGRDGIRVESCTLADVSVPDCAEITLGNIIGFNKSYGIEVTSSAKVRITANFVGVVNVGSNVFNIGNALDGIRVTTSNHVIGGASFGNFIAANGTSGVGSGITISGGGTTNVVVQGNTIGRDPFNLVDNPNHDDGITIANAGSNTIGGSNSGEPNIIAGNGRHGIKVSTSGNGWANLISQNSIFNNTGLGIDLDVVNDGVDPTDNSTPGPDPNLLYSNHGQNAPVISTINPPHYDTVTGNTIVDWTLDTSANTPITLEFFVSDAADGSGHGEGQTFLGKLTTTTDGTGHAANTASVIVPASATDTRGKYITMTATPTDLEDTPDPSNVSAPANNTSEFSNAVRVPNPGSLQFSSPTYSVAENVPGGLATITVTRTGGSDTAVSVDYATSDGTATQPADYTATSGTLNWADGDAASKTFTIPIVDDNIFEGDETVNLTLTNATNYAQLGTPSTAVLTIVDNDTQPTISIGNVTQAEGNVGTSNFVFNVTLSNPSTQTITVHYATADGTATTADNDYVATSGTLTFNPLVTSQQATVTVNGDTKFEPDEAFTVTLSAPTNATLSASSVGTGTITNDDTQPTVIIGDVTANEGNAATTAFNFPVTLSNASYQSVTVNFSTADGTATVADNDYVAVAGGLVTIPAGATTGQATVNVNGDTKFEPNETFTVTLSTPTNATLGATVTGTGTITNDDTQPTVTIGPVTANEGNAATTAFNFPVTLSNASYQSVTVNYSTADGTATVADNDYVAVAGGLVTIPAGATTGQATVNVNGDTKFEPNETFTVTLSTPVNATLGVTVTGTGTITNDDSQPTISINNVSQNEGNAGNTPFNFTVTLSNPSYQTVSVNYATADGTATVANTDYVAVASTPLTFNPGVTSMPVTVNVVGDTNVEPNETFSVNLTTPTNATIATPTGTGTILNDDNAQPTFSIDNVTMAEGNAGQTAFVFTVTLSPAAVSQVTVDASTADGTATVADGDYVANTQTLTFPAGATTQQFTVLVNGDTKFEPDETFSVNLSNNTAGTLLSGLPGTGTITNDDTQPTISISDVSQNEGNAGTTPFNFAVTLSNATYQTVTVNYATADGTATVANNDYVAIASTPLTFNPGVTSMPVTVNVNGDLTVEPDETFTVNLSTPANATILKAAGTGTIVNDDGITPSFSINNVTQNEGNAGTTAFTFTVTLSAAAASQVTVQAATADGTATVADNDYAANTQTLTFPVGVTTQPFTVNVNGDTKFEPNETFTVNLSGNSAGTTISGATGTGTITNDDTQPTISIANVSQNEGNAGNTAFVFNVTLSNPTSQTVTVNYATADGTATIANNDYVAATGTLTFNPGVTTQTITVNVVGDSTVEPDETFTVNLSVPANATIANGVGTGTIVNDDSAGPTFSINSVSQNEGTTGTTPFVFTVTLSSAAASSVSVQAATADGTATVADGDYAANTQTLTFAPGVTTQQFTVLVNGDTKFEPDETFTVNLSGNSAGTALSGVPGTGTIVNDDAQPLIRIAGVSKFEGNSGTTPFPFTVDLSNPSYQTITVDFATADGTATTANNDYVAATGTVTFPPGTTSQPITIQVNGDTTIEPNENFLVNLSNPVNATIGGGQAAATIINDDPAGEIPMFGDMTLALLALLMAAAAFVALRKL